jgi:hypothetical protein
MAAAVGRSRLADGSGDAITMVDQHGKTLARRDDYAFKTVFVAA